MSLAVYTHPRVVPTLHPLESQAGQVAEVASPGGGVSIAVFPGREKGQNGRSAALQDAYTLGRSRYVSGGLLDHCTSPAERAGFIGAEADARKADLRAMLAVGFDEWQLHRHEYDEEA